MWIFFLKKNYFAVTVNNTHTDYSPSKPVGAYRNFLIVLYLYSFLIKLICAYLTILNNNHRVASISKLTAPPRKAPNSALLDRHCVDIPALLGSTVTSHAVTGLREYVKFIKDKISLWVMGV